MNSSPPDILREQTAIRQAVLVLGMHRSGTSALAGLLNRLGVSAPLTLMPANEHNPLGFWESNALCRLHDRLLRAGQSNWDAWTRFSPHEIAPSAAATFAEELQTLLAQEFGAAPLFVVKDPRICRFVTFWLDGLRAFSVTPSAVIVVRSPAEVARSLMARDGLHVEQSLMLWLRHMLDAELDTRSIPRSIVRYEDLLADWKAVADRMSAEIGVTWPNGSDTAAGVADFLRPELRHHALAIDAIDVEPPLSEWLMRTCRAFDLLIDAPASRTREARDELDSVRREFDLLSIMGRVLEREQHERRQHVSTLEAEYEALRHHASAVEDERDRLLQRASMLESARAQLEQRAFSLEAHAERADRELTDTRRRLDAQAAQIDSLTRNLEGSEDQVRALHNSLSWRSTAPLRTAFDILLRVRRPAGASSPKGRDEL